MNRDRFVRCYYVVVFVILDSFMVNDTDKDILKLYKSIKKPVVFTRGFRLSYNTLLLFWTQVSYLLTGLPHLRFTQCFEFNLEQFPVIRFTG